MEAEIGWGEGETEKETGIKKRKTSKDRQRGRERNRGGERKKLSMEGERWTDPVVHLWWLRQ